MDGDLTTWSSGESSELVGWKLTARPGSEDTDTLTASSGLVFFLQMGI